VGFLECQAKASTLMDKVEIEPRDWDVGEMVDGDLINYFGFVIEEF
jgi:hypothetical protein